jgi:hypothetical protein
VLATELILADSMVVCAVLGLTVPVARLTRVWMVEELESARDGVLAVVLPKESEKTSPPKVVVK